jgi:two-component system response regulator MprA
LFLTGAITLISVNSLPANTVAVIEDDQSVREMLTSILTAHGYHVTAHADGEAAMRDEHTAGSCVAIIDISLPGIDGLEVCRRLRANGRTAPVMMLTARHEVQDRVLGLDAGADDYLVKPFALDELLARVRALHRRHGTAASAVDTQLELDDLTIDPGTRVATRGENPLDLTRIEFDLLHLLVAKSPAVLTRDAIHEQIWGYEQEHMSNSLEVFVSQLRRKTERDGRPRLVHTVRGVGYTARRDPQAPTR